MKTSEKETINSWFDMRYVVDNEKFVTFFQRVLMRDYGRYRELLRIEPNISKYDWLVQQYQEAQTYEKGSDVTGVTGSSNDTSNSTNTASRSNSVTGTNSESGTNTKQSGTITDNSQSSSDVTLNSGTDTTVNSGNSNRSNTTSNTAGGHDTTTDNSHTNVKALDKENPMSVTYPDGMSIDGIGGNTACLNWQYPTKQDESDTRQNGENRVDYGRTDNGTSSENFTESGTGSTTYGKNTRVTGALTGQTNTTETENGSFSNSSNTTETGLSSETATGQTTHNITTDSETVANRNNIRQHINSGRSVDTATLLSQARQYIQNTSAMQWLLKQLDVCFMGVYNDSNEDYIF